MVVIVDRSTQAFVRGDAVRRRRYAVSSYDNVRTRHVYSEHGRARGRACGPGGPPLRGDVSLARAGRGARPPWRLDGGRLRIVCGVARLALRAGASRGSGACARGQASARAGSDPRGVLPGRVVVREGASADPRRDGRERGGAPGPGRRPDSRSTGACGSRLSSGDGRGGPGTARGRLPERVLGPRRIAGGARPSLGRRRGAAPACARRAAGRSVATGRRFRGPATRPAGIERRSAGSGRRCGTRTPRPGSHRW